MGTVPRPAAERFWSRVTLDRDPNACWEWKAALFDDGYPAFRDGRQMRGNRWLYQHIHGSIPPGMEVCHTCDNPACVRPSHLWLGTRQQNHDDMVRKRRSATGDKSGRRKHPERYPRGDAHHARRHPETRQGERNGRAKLTEDQVRDIRRRFAEGGVSKEALGREYKVYGGQIGKIVSRKAWTNVTA